LSRLADILPRTRMLPPAVLPCTYGAIGSRPEIPESVLKSHAAGRLYTALCTQIHNMYRFVIDATAEFTLLHAISPEWPLVDNDNQSVFPPLAIPGGEFWLEYRRPRELHPALEAYFGLESLPTYVGWLINVISPDDATATGRQPGLFALLAMHYGTGKGDRNAFNIFPAAQLNLPLSVRGVINGDEQITFIGDIDPNMVCDPTKVTLLCKMLFWPAIVAMVFAKSSQLERVKPEISAALAAKRAKKGWHPDLDYYVMNAAEPLNRLRMEFHSGLVGLADAMVAYKLTQGRKIILPSDLR